MRRIFIAIKVVPEETLINMISNLKSGLIDDAIKWTSIDNIHVTLVFLGDTEDYITDKIRLMLYEECTGYGKFNIHLKGCGIFRSMSDPRILWTGVQDSDKLMSLNVTLQNGLKQLGIRLEDRPYNPHLTLGRIKHLKDINILKSLVEKFHNSEIQVVPVNEIILYESILLQSGPVYNPIEKFTL